jgi:hypothetical protein
MEYRRTTLHPYDEDELYDDIESHSWAYPDDRQSLYWILWTEIKNLISRCINKEYKSQ